MRKRRKKQIVANGENTMITDDSLMISGKTRVLHCDSYSSHRKELQSRTKSQT